MRIKQQETAGLIRRKSLGRVRKAVGKDGVAHEDARIPGSVMEVPSRRDKASLRVRSKSA